MKMLALHTDTDIKAMLINEPLESAPAHIANGYTDLQSAWQAGTITAEVIDVDEADMYCPDSFEVVGGTVQRKAV